MHHTKGVLTAVLFGAATLIGAEPDNGKVLPSKELIVPNHVFLEMGGGINFPLEFFSQGNIAMTDYGADFFVGAGYNWSGWLLGLKYTHDQWGEGKGSYALMQNFKNNIVEFKLRRVLSKNSIHWLPGWLEIVPGLGTGVNFITTDYYPSKRAKEDGRMNSVSLFDSGANCFFYDASLELSFFLGTDMCIPFAGIDYNAFYDTSIGGGFAGFARAYLGIRTYPLGIVNDVQRHLAKKRAEREEKALAALAALPEPDATATEPAASEATEPAAAPVPPAEPLPPKAELIVTPATDFTPDGDGFSDTVSIIPHVENLSEPPASWKIEITDPQNHPFRTWSGTGTLPEEIVWDGTSDSGEVVFSLNTYTVTMTVVPAETAAADNAGEPPVVAAAPITTGVLMIVIIPEKQWKIVVNTIHFDPDRATFDRIPREQQEENKETLDSIARQIKLHGSVDVLIEGYANNVTNTEREDREELVPLSNLRANAILNMLVERGLEQSTLSAEGRGGAHPLAAWEDRQNWWKNRRVEFIVTKED